MTIFLCLFLGWLAGAASVIVWGLCMAAKKPTPPLGQITRCPLPNDVYCDVDQWKACGAPGYFTDDDCPHDKWGGTDADD